MSDCYLQRAPSQSITHHCHVCRKTLRPVAAPTSSRNPGKIPMKDVQGVPQAEEKSSWKRVRCSTVSVEFRAYATQRLVAWRKALLVRLYPDSLVFTPKTLMSDTCVQVGHAPECFPSIGIMHHSHSPASLRFTWKRYSTTTCRGDEHCLFMMRRRN